MANKNKLIFYQITRVIIGILIPIPFLLAAYVWHVVNLSYHPNTYESKKFWFDAAVVIFPVALIGLTIASWRFRSEKIGLIASVIGISALVIIISLAWSSV
jgi:hypothetical protein